MHVKKVIVLKMNVEYVYMGTTDKFFAETIWSI